MSSGRKKVYHEETVREWYIKGLKGKEIPSWLDQILPPDPVYVPDTRSPLALEIDGLCKNLIEKFIPPNQIASRIACMDRLLATPETQAQLGTDEIRTRLHSLADILHLSGRLQLAEVMADRAVKAVITSGNINVRLWHTAAMIKRQLKKYDEAGKLFADIVAKAETDCISKPPLVYFLLCLSECWMTLEKYDEAVAVYARANQLSSENADTPVGTRWIDMHRRNRAKLVRRGYVDDPDGMFRQRARDRAACKPEPIQATTAANPDDTAVPPKPAQSGPDWLDTMLEQSRQNYAANMRKKGGRRACPRVVFGMDDYENAETRRGEAAGITWGVHIATMENMRVLNHLVDYWNDPSLIKPDGMLFFLIRSMVLAPAIMDYEEWFGTDWSRSRYKMTWNFPHHDYLRGFMQGAIRVLMEIPSIEVPPQKGADQSGLERASAAQEVAHG